MMNLDPQDIVKLTKKQRLKILASLIVDKIEEDREQGYPLLKKIEAEEQKAVKKKSKPSE